MKKYLLGLLAIPFILIAFSNAETINVSCIVEEGCTPFQINISNNNCVNGVPQLTLSNFSCVLHEDIETEDTSCGLSFENGDGSYYNIVYENGELSDFSCNIVNSDNELFYVNGVNGEKDFIGNLNVLNSNTGGGNDNTGGGGDNPGGGGDSGGGNVGSLLPGGEVALSGAISGLTSTINEFIPLMVYVGLGVLGVIIGFFAIKWLIAYVRKETFTIFKK